MLLTANDKDGGGLAGRSWHRPWPYTVPLATAGGQESPWTAVPTSVLQRGSQRPHAHTPMQTREVAEDLQGDCPAPRARARARPGSPSTRSQGRGVPSTHGGKPPAQEPLRGGAVPTCEDGWVWQGCGARLPQSCLWHPQSTCSSHQAAHDSVYLSQRCLPALHSLGFHALCALSELRWGPAGPVPPCTHLPQSQTREGCTLMAQQRPSPSRVGRPARQRGPWPPGKGSRAPSLHALRGQMCWEEPQL